MGFDFLIPTRAIQFSFGFVILGLTSYVALRYPNKRVTSATDSSPVQNDVTLITAIFNFLVLIYLLLVRTRLAKIVPRRAAIAMESLSVLMWLASFIALIVYVNMLRLCRGSTCNSLRAAIVFSAVETLCWMYSCFMCVTEWPLYAREAYVKKPQSFRWMWVCTWSAAAVLPVLSSRLIALPLS